MTRRSWQGQNLLRKITLVSIGVSENQRRTSRTKIWKVDLRKDKIKYLIFKTQFSLSQDSLTDRPSMLQVFLKTKTIRGLRRNRIRVHAMTMATTQEMKHTKRFAPLDPAKRSGSGAPALKGIVFDVDGTLW